MGAAINLATTYTEADPNNRISESTVTATFAAIARNENAYLYKSWGVGYFGDFVHDFETTGTTWANGSKLAVWGVSNSVAALSGWAAGLYLQLNATSTTAGTYTLGEIGGSTSVGASIGKTIMYWRIERNGTTLTAKRATSAANRTAGVWAETLTLTVAATTYQYQYAGSSFNDANTTAVSQTVANIKGTKMTSAGTPFDSAYMAGAAAGDWNAGGTWGNTGSTKGTGFPGSAADVTNIDAGDTVTYNVSETNQLGAMTVYGTLSFKPDMDTKISFGSTAYIDVFSGGLLTVGTALSPIQTGNKAELYWSAADNSCGIRTAAGGFAKMYGTDKSGGTERTYLVADWSSGQTFTVKGDVTAKWAVGQTLVVQRFLATTISGTPGGEYTIASMAANGSDTDVTISEAAPGVTFRAGALVLHTTRNIIAGKLSAVTTLGNYNSARPSFLGAGVAGAIALHFEYAAIVGFYVFGYSSSASYGMETLGCVIRNGWMFGGNLYNDWYHVHTRDLFISANVVAGHISAKFDQCVFGFQTFVYSNRFSWFTDCYLIVNGGTNHFYDNGTCEFRECDFVENYYTFGKSGTVQPTRYFNCNGNKFRHHANTNTSAADFFSVAATERFQFFNTNFVNDPPAIVGVIGGGGIASFDDYNNVQGDSRKYVGYYAMKTNGAVLRGGGAPTSLEIFGMDVCTIDALMMPIFEWVEWEVPASAQTRTIYIRGGNGGTEDWSVYPTAAELYLEAEYYDEAGTCHRAFATSTEVLSDNTTWTAFNVSFVPGKVGLVIYRLRIGLLSGGIAAKKLYADTQLLSA